MKSFKEIRPINEGGMPSSVIKQKQHIASMSDAEKKAHFKGKSVPELNAMAWRHGYGKDSGVYAKHHTPNLDIKIESTVAEASDDHRLDNYYGVDTPGKKAARLASAAYKSKDPADHRLAARAYHKAIAFHHDGGSISSANDALARHIHHAKLGKMKPITEENETFDAPLTEDHELTHLSYLAGKASANAVRNHSEANHRAAGEAHIKAASHADVSKSGAGSKYSAAEYHRTHAKAEFDKADSFKVKMTEDTVDESASDDHRLDNFYGVDTPGKKAARLASAAYKSKDPSDHRKAAKAYHAAMPFHHETGSPSSARDAYQRHLHHARLGKMKPLPIKEETIAEATSPDSMAAYAASKVADNQPYSASKKEIGDAHAHASELHHKASKTAKSPGDYAIHFSKSVNHQQIAKYYGGRKPVIEETELDEAKKGPNPSPAAHAATKLANKTGKATDHRKAHDLHYKAEDWHENRGNIHDADAHGDTREYHHEILRGMKESFNESAKQSFDVDVTHIHPDDRKEIFHYRVNGANDRGHATNIAMQKHRSKNIPMKQFHTDNMSAKPVTEASKQAPVKEKTPPEFSKKIPAKDRGYDWHAYHGSDLSRTAFGKKHGVKSESVEEANDPRNHPDALHTWHGVISHQHPLGGPPVNHRYVVRNAAKYSAEHRILRSHSAKKLAGTFAISKLVREGVDESLTEASSYHVLSTTANGYTEDARRSQAAHLHMKAAHAHHAASEAHSKQIAKHLKADTDDAAEKVAPHEEAVAHHDKAAVRHKYFVHAAAAKQKMDEDFQVEEDTITESTASDAGSKARAKSRDLAVAVTPSQKIAAHQRAAAAHYKAAHHYLKAGNLAKYDEHLDAKYAHHEAASKHAATEYKEGVEPLLFTIEEEAKLIEDADNEALGLRIAKQLKLAVAAGRAGNTRAQQYHLGIVKSLKQNEETTTNEAVKNSDEDDSKNLSTEEQHELKKLETLVRLGLVDKSKLTQVHRIFKRLATDQLINQPADREVLTDLFQNLISIVTGDDSIFNKVRFSVARKF